VLGNAIKHAELIKISERNDVRCADVEVTIKGMKDVLLVELTPSVDRDYKLTHIYRKEASRELDWYDNDLHQAYKDITKEWLQGDMEEFKMRVLAFGSVRNDLSEQFEVFHKAALFRVDEQENESLLH
jgi:hypothetical protein